MVMKYLDIKSARNKIMVFKTYSVLNKPMPYLNVLGNI
jgi:hypothetical protein